MNFKFSDVKGELWHEGELIEIEFDGGIKYCIHDLPFGHIKQVYYQMLDSVGMLNRRIEGDMTPLAYEIDEMKAGLKAINEAFETVGNGFRKDDTINALQYALNGSWYASFDSSNVEGVTVPDVVIYAEMLGALTDDDKTYLKKSYEHGKGAKK